MGWERALCQSRGLGFKSHHHSESVLSCPQVQTLVPWSYPVGSCMPGPLDSELGLGVQREEPWFQALQAEKNLVVSSGQ